MMEVGLVEPGSVDLTVLLIGALGQNEAIRKVISRLYESHRYECYALAKAHPLYQHPLLRKGDIEQEIASRKALGVYLLAQTNSDVQAAFDKILAEGWRYPKQYVETHQEIDFQDFILRLNSKRSSKDTDHADWLNAQCLMVRHFARMANKPLVPGVVLTLVAHAMEGRVSFSEEGTAMNQRKLSLDTVPPEARARAIRLKDALYARYGRFTPVTELFICAMPEYAKVLSFIFDFTGLSVITLAEQTPLKEREIDELLLGYLTQYSGDDIPHAATYLCAAILLMHMGKAYQAVKQQFFRHNVETAYIEMEMLEHRATAAEKAAEQIQGELRTTVRAATERERAQEREIARLKSELAQAQRGREELNALRDLLFSMDQEQAADDADAPADLETLQRLRAIVVGGHERWQARMKEHLPASVFLHPDVNTFDPRLADNAELVVVYSHYLSHKLYERVMAAIEGKNIPVMFLGQQNEQAGLKEIARYLSQRSA